RAYADGLLARTSPEAVAGFRRAVQEDPFHQRANSMLVLLLILLGELPEARHRPALAEGPFPQSPPVPLLHAPPPAPEDDLPAANALLEKTRPQLSKAEVATARALVHLTHQGHNVLAAVGPDASGSLTFSLLKLWIMVPGLAEARRKLVADREGATAGL